MWARASLCAYVFVCVCVCVCDAVSYVLGVYIIRVAHTGEYLPGEYLSFFSLDVDLTWETHALLRCRCPLYVRTRRSPQTDWRGRVLGLWLRLRYAFGLGICGTRCQARGEATASKCPCAAASSIRMAQTVARRGNQRQQQRPWGWIPYSESQGRPYVCTKSA